MINQDILDRFKKEPNRITIITTTTDAVNGYGYLRKYEVVIEFVKRHCVKCKVVDADLQGDFCPVNGWHKMANGFMQETRFMIDESLLLELLRIGNGKPK